MQYVYIPLNGDRFLFAFFSTTTTASAIVHSNLFYEAVRFVTQGEFRIFFGVFDGATPNRKIFNSQFAGKNAVSLGFKTMNKATGDPLILIMDPSVSLYEMKV